MAIAAQQQPFYNEEPWMNDRDDYDEISQLGQGAYGVVYLVRNRHTNQEVSTVLRHPLRRYHHKYVIRIRILREKLCLW
jgi:serine/threonine protein kinase